MPLRQDVTKLQQILQNLLSNAIKFTPEGGRVALKAEADAGYVILTASDTGVGIAPEEQELGLLRKEPLRAGERVLTCGAVELKAELLEKEAAPVKAPGA